MSSTSAAHEQLERCPQCKTLIGSTARFKRAIASVLSEADALALGRAYDRRSRTIHDAQLHGRESIAGGWGTLSLYESDPAFTFEAGLLQGAHVASRALVWRELGALGWPPDAR